MPNDVFCVETEIFAARAQKKRTRRGTERAPLQRRGGRRLDMRFEELTIETTTAGSEVLGGVLLKAGVACFSTEDPQDLRDIMEQRQIPFDYVEDGLLENGPVRVRVYLAQGEQGALQRAEILSGIEALRRADIGVDLGPLTVGFAGVDEEEWAENWKRYFHPLQIGKRFLVRPSWEECDAGGRVVLQIDPASSFGTGQHETTAVCLEMLEDCELQGARLLDMGCGSGILAIGAMLLGAEEAVCVDIDETACETARRNAAENGIPPERMKFFCGNVLNDKKLLDILGKTRYNIITANIVADVIVGMLPLFRAWLAASGVLLCSGIIAAKKERVLDALAENGFAVTATAEKNDWVGIACRLK